MKGFSYPIRSVHRSLPFASVQMWSKEHLLDARVCACARVSVGVKPERNGFFGWKKCISPPQVLIRGCSRAKAQNGTVLVRCGLPNPHERPQILT